MEECFTNDNVQYWNENNCLNQFSQFINQTGNEFKYNYENNMILQGVILSYMNSYVSQNGRYSLTSSNKDPFQSEILNMCNSVELPGVCEPFLSQYCENFTRNEVGSDITLTNFCGCYTEPNPYIEKYSIKPSCDNLCNRSLSSRKLLSLQDGTLDLCENNVCVIDDINLNFSDSVVDSGINFTSLCSSCIGGNCTCVISGVNLSNLLGSIGIVENISQYCGTGSICIVKDASGNIISEDICKEFKQEMSFFQTLNLNYIFIFMFLFVAFCFIFYFISKNG